MRLATRVLPADQSWTLVAPELVDASPANPQFAVAALMLETRSAKVCDAIARADAARPAATRVFLKGSADAQVRTLIPSLFGGAATPADLRAARQFLRDLAAPTPTDGWIGLCTLYLSGPRLRHLSYVRGS